MPVVSEVESEDHQQNDEQMYFPIIFLFHYYHYSNSYSFWKLCSRWKNCIWHSRQLGESKSYNTSHFGVKYSFTSCCKELLLNNVRSEVNAPHENNPVWRARQRARLGVTHTPPHTLCHTLGTQGTHARALTVTTHTARCTLETMTNVQVRVQTRACSTQSNRR